MAELTGATPEPAVPTIGDAFGWAARDPEWITKLLLMGLIGLIPIVGALQQAGWLLTMLDNLRAGRQEVPPAAFRYATRGVWLWLAGVIYVVVFVFVFYGVFLAFIAGLTGVGAASQRDHFFNAFALLFIPLFFLWAALIGLLALVLWIFVPAIIELTDRKGLAGAFDFAGIVHAVRTDPQHNLAAAALAFVAYVISGLGVYLCWIGVIFTAPYALTVLAAVLRWYEVRLKPGALPSPIGAAAR